MLKALELSGFKSFADRTRFEFPSGISVIVGPNGSGKSNIVDAVKWVLGSQSAKALRGKEMVDVIFNGCATRGPLGTAEATLTLDNTDGRLAIDAKEVHVTRRVYRSSEGEYLLNRQPCRLRDIRELLAGTGITTESYYIIEQGKVDALLQSSPRDRRVIFEEAAGISQFKAKKAAAARRMEHVEQNLLRLSDIVDEVESRLRSVRLQAGKARRYRDCTQRLQQLRTEVGLVDWRSLTRQLIAREQQLADLRQKVDARTAAVQRAEADARELELQIESQHKQLRELEAAASVTREQIAARQATVDNQRARGADLQQEVARLREQLAAMNSRDGAAGDQERAVRLQLREAEEELAAIDAERQTQVALAEASRRELAEARASLNQARSELVESTRNLQLLDGEASELQSQLAAAQVAVVHSRERLAELAQQCDGQCRELAEHERAEAIGAAQVESHEASLRAAEQQLVVVRRELARADKQCRQLEGRLTRTRSRITVLSELEHRLEGLAGGVREALRMAAENVDGPLGEVRGVVADLFHVDVDSAPLVELALGERAQYVVIASSEPLWEQFDGQPLAFGGRVGFLSLGGRVHLTALDHVDLSAEPGVMGRADRFVESAPECELLVRRLLGRTWLVDRLATAMRLSRSAGRGLDFVTSDGQMLTADGTLIVGPSVEAAGFPADADANRLPLQGVLSRRSELRACQAEVAELDGRLAQHAAVHSRLDQQRAEAEAQLAASAAAYTAAAGKLADCRQQSAAARLRLERLGEDQAQTAAELQRAEQRIEMLQSDVESNRERHAKVEDAVGRFAEQVRGSELRLAELERQHGDLQTTATDRQIAAAKCEQRVEMLRQQLEHAQRSGAEFERALSECRQRMDARQAQLAELEQAMLAHRQALAELFVQKEQHDVELAQQAAASDFVRRKRAELAERIRGERDELAALHAQQHKIEVSVTRIRHERQTLCERMQDDYGIDLAEAASNAEKGDRSIFDNESQTAPSHDGKNGPVPFLDRTAVEREIAELRDQVNNIGAINLEALDELEQLEGRFEKLSQQYRDLVDAKLSLERIIGRINVDSRQLFLATLETIRGHFQELFRRLFGGGQADIVADEAEDVLECGIEIVVQPPGKEACNISLLSGGEKTLTCVALLLAVFRSKPSPFCVLDEVDAALDEANIGRFTAVLREFLSFTQFVVVTHSKKTMSGADTLYGVTMEESGVSKRVSVRFEDVGEDGQVAPARLRPAA